MMMFLSRLGDAVWKWNFAYAFRLLHKLYPDHGDLAMALIGEGMKEAEIAAIAECEVIEYVTVVPDGDGAYQVHVESGEQEEV